ncbi:MAG TPA: PadR family transcriptional regulator [Longimicrobiaceae bacterium]|jgi:DNA-binding PadR family transcriptional regulator|nr:PadR family transcriptional regulator [Longimicrobiaceae bacterium]
MFGAWDCGPRGRRGPGFIGTFWAGPGGGQWGGGAGPGRGRVFGHGDLKYVILSLLAEKPRHGYEIIKELEERVGGAYSPSPGTVYPTLALLEDLGYAAARTEEGNRKVYEITDEGRRHLAENRSIVDDIFGRVEEMGSFVFGEGMAGLGSAFGALSKATFRNAMRRQGDQQWLARVREILERAAREIEGLDQA